METPLSIIIPIYNVELYLDRCLLSVERAVRQAGTDAVEILLIDDGSTDRSGRIAERHAERCACMRVLHQRNAGVAAARNAGLSEASGNWLYFMDSDDWLDADGVRLLLAEAAGTEWADIILFDAWQDTGKREVPWEHFREEAVWSTRKQLDRLQRGVLYYPMAYPETGVPLAAPWDKLYRRDFILANGLRFQEELRVLDDMVFNMESIGRAARVVYVKQKIYHYRKVEGSVTNAYRADRVEQDRAVWRYIGAYMRGQAALHRWDGEASAAFLQAFYCRIIRSFAICCRLNFYHVENPKSRRERQAYVKEVLRGRPYRTAFGRVRLRNAEWRLKPVILLVRCGLYRGLYPLYLAERIRSRIQDLRRSSEWRLRSQGSRRRG